MTNCPPEAILRAVGTDAVGEATFAGLEEHVERCPDCQGVLEAATKAAPLAAHPATARSTPPTLPGLVIERELGRGGASVVYLARESVLNRDVAVKLFPRNSLVDPHTRAHWLAEARALSRVPHDQVVAIHQVGEDDQWLWLVLEYVAGKTLKDRLSEPLPPRDAARLTETIARAVGYFHARGVCHLDLKPSNILLDGEPGAPWEAVSPKISDFGIARLEGESGATETGANGPKGTPSYMAPEQVAAIPGTIGTAADLHALGALLYHLLTGRPPFQGATSAETLDQVRNQDPVPPRRLNDRILRDLETICLTCLEKSPNRRYRSAEALAGDLRLWLEGRPIRARRVSPMGHVWRWCRRHPAVAGLLLVLALTLATGVVGLFVLLNLAEAERSRYADARRDAEAYAQFSANAADQLGLILYKSIQPEKLATPDQMKASLLRLRSSVAVLRTRGGAPSTAFGILEQGLGAALWSYGEIEAARELLDYAVADLKGCLSRNPADEDARHYLAQALCDSAQVAMETAEFETVLDGFEQAAALLTDSKPADSTFVWLTQIYIRLEHQADVFRRRGWTRLQSRAARVGERILSYLLGPDAARSTDASVAALEALGRLLRRESFRAMSAHDDGRIRRQYEVVASDWLALSVLPSSPFRSPEAGWAFDRDPEAGALAFLGAIRGNCSKLGLADSLVPAAADRVITEATTLAAEQRNAGRLDEARATVARIMAIAGRLVRDYPDNAYSYRVLSIAHDQIKKNALQVGDDRATEAAIERSIEAARRALILDPDQPRTKPHLEKLTEQLAAIKADPTALRAQAP